MRRAANAILVFTIAIFVAALAWIAVHPVRGLVQELQGDTIFDLILIGASVALAWLGRLIVRRSANRIGLAFLGVALGTALIGGTDIPLKSATVPYPGWMPLVAFGPNVGRALVVSCLTIVLLLFPTGSLPSPRWRWVAWLWLAGSISLGIGALIGPFDLDQPGITNPIHVDALTPVSNALGAGGIALLFVFAAGITSLVIKARQGNAETKTLTRLLSLAGGIAVTGFAIAAIAEPGSLAGTLGFALFLIAVFVGIPASLIIPVLKYRLYDIDLVISKTIVFAGLTLFISAVYVAIVVGVGTRVGHDNLAARVLATAVVAVLFQPARERMRRFANRIVYGQRATPYEVLARFSDRVGGAYAAEDVLARTARVIAEGVGAAKVDIWLHVGHQMAMGATWPATDVPPDPIDTTGDDLPSIGADHVAPVRHRGELLGAIAVTKPRGEPLAPQDVNIVDHLAEQSSLVIANVRLTADLEARLATIEHQAAALRASRQRIVAAQDEERRRLERNIHDGAQQHLVALAVKLRLAKATLLKDPQRATAMLAELREQVNDALDTLRSLALGVYPPLLEEQGIAAALAAQYTRSGLGVRLSTDGLGRYPVEIEAAVYFCVLEALQNAAKYAQATRIDVVLSDADAFVSFEVRDDGVGFDAAGATDGTGLQGMRDRLAVFGGEATLASQPGHGTTVRGRVPIDTKTGALV